MNIDELISEALFKPDFRLIEALKKKLTALEVNLLAIWLDNEREYAALNEWNKHKDRIKD